MATAPVDPRVFSVYALKFRNHNPKDYEKFMALLNRYVYDLTVAVTQASPSDILVAQGRAQEGLKFLQVFSEFRDETGKPVT